MSFSDVFKSSFIENVVDISVTDILLAMVFSCVVGAFIFWVYKLSFKGVMYSTGFGLTLVGLSMVTTLVILAVTSNVVLSLGMVGALSIVRFRTAIKEPMEIVFLFWAIAAGIVTGAGMFLLAAVGSVLIGVILYFLSNKNLLVHPYLLVLDCENETAEQAAVELLKSSVDRQTVKAKTVSASGIELSVEVRLKKDNNTAFVTALTALEGIQSASLVTYNGQFMD